MIPASIENQRKQIRKKSWARNKKKSKQWKMVVHRERNPRSTVSVVFSVSIRLQRAEVRSLAAKGWRSVHNRNRAAYRSIANSESTTLTAKPIDAPACSMFSRKCRCYSRSTSRSRNSDQRNATVHPSDSGTNGTSSRRSTTRQDGSVSETQKRTYLLLSVLALIDTVIFSHKLAIYHLDGRLFRELSNGRRFHPFYYQQRKVFHAVSFELC